MSLRTTVLGQMSEIRKLHVADRRRQAVTSKMMKADHRRSAEMKELRIAALQGHVTALQGQHGPVGGPAQPKLPEEAGYNQRFQELALLCVRMFPEESDKIERYVGGLPDMIHGNIVASKPKTRQEAVEMAIELMDKKVSTIDERQDKNKRKFENTSRNNQNQQQQNKRQNTGRAYTTGTGEKKPYGGSKPLCAKCNYHHDGSCAPKCHKCNKFGHFSVNCRTLQEGWSKAEEQQKPWKSSWVNDKSEEESLKNVPIVQDFPKVFPEDLPGIPPTRQVEFQIDLILGAAPVARATYRLTPSEMKELLSCSFQMIMICEIRYHPGKANVVADTLSRKERDQPLRVRALVMTIGLDLPKQILNAQTEARKLENIKNKNVGGMLLENAKDPEKRIIHNNGQIERTIKLSRICLCACGIGLGKGWVNHLPLVEFSYNNSYHASIKAAPFEALYGRKCRSPVCWTEVGEAQILGPELIQETTKKIVQIKQRMQATRDQQKSYADLKCKPMEFQVGDKVMLKFSPLKGVVRFGKRGKLNPRYVGPFKVIEMVGEVAFKLELPEELSRVHNTFYVCNLKKCYADELLSRIR
ncbi:putative reverse transcriptase domain-containing protein [Tanacetum coccineum]